MVETDLKVPHSLGQYFNSDDSPLSPYNRKGGGGFAYGTFPLFLTKITGEVLQHQDFFPLNLVKDGLAKAFATAPTRPKRSVIFVQSQVPQHAVAALSCR
jgi:hypothetical protein